MTTTQPMTLADYEALIEKNPRAYMPVGLALASIRVGKLHKQSSFREYCAERWNHHGARGDQLISSARAAADLKAAGYPAPAVEWQAGALAPLPEETRRQVWRLALEISGGEPTAPIINTARRQIEAAQVPPRLSRAGRRIPPRSQQAALTAGIATLHGLCGAIEQIDAIDPAITTEEAAQWVRDLSDSLRVLRSLTAKLKEHRNGNHR